MQKATTQTHLDSIAAERAEFLGKLAIKETLLNALPKDMPITRLGSGAYKANIRLTLPAASVQDAIDRILPELPAMPVVLVRNGNTSFRPEETYERGDRDTVTEVKPVLWQASLVDSARKSTEVTMRWWSKVGNITVLVVVDIEDSVSKFVCEEIRDSFNRVVDRKWSLENAPIPMFGDAVRFASGERGVPGDWVYFSHR